MAAPNASDIDAGKNRFLELTGDELLPAEYIFSEGGEFNRDSESWRDTEYLTLTDAINAAEDGGIIEFTLYLYDQTRGTWRIYVDY